MDKLPRFRDYFAKRSVLLTGGTGFIGMALIEGLLGASPDLGRIYVLVREKKGLSPQERITKLLSSEIFNHHSDEVKAKVVPVVGEITAENLGLSSQVLEEIRENVSVVIHNAGLIKFNRPLKEAVIMNVLTTLRCIELAKALRHLSAFVYSSTILANTNISERVKEEVYKTKRSPREMIKLALETPSTLNYEAEFKSILLERHANSYCYSKQLAENLIAKEMSGLPAGIVRSGLVYGFYEHQIPGWMGNSQSGHCSLIKGQVKGVVRSVYGYPERVAFSTPCDYVVKGTLALTVFLAMQTQPLELPHIIHMSNNNSINPLTVQGFADALNEESWNNPCDSFFFLPRSKVRNGWRSDLYILFCYLIALMFYIPDHLLKFMPNWMNGIKLVTIQYQASKHFSELSSTISDLIIENAQTLSRRLHPEDQRTYSFDIAGVNWNRLLGNIIAWLRKYYYKDSCSITWMHRAVQVGCLVIEGAWYFGIFFSTTLAFLVVGFLLQLTIIYVLLAGVAAGVGLAGFAIWL